MKKYRFIVVIAAMALMMSGCAIHTTDPITGEKKISHIAKGGGYGAVGGAALGAAIGGIVGGGSGAALGAAIGGGTGAVVGSGAGYYLDNQEKILREKLERTGVGVFREGDKLRLVMPSNILFEVNSTQINGGFYEVLDSITLVLNEFDKTHLKVYGFTDSQGSFESNQLLSENRAMSVLGYFKHQGVNPSRLYALGLSERHPIASNGTKSGRSLNRRVELSIEPSEI